MTPETPRTYKYQLSAEEFVFAFTATDEEFAKRADEMRGKGVERLRAWEIEKKYGVQLDLGKHFTFIGEAEIIGNETIMIRDIQTPRPNLFVRKSKLPAITLQNCQLAQIENGEPLSGATSFYFLESTTGNFHILQQSTTGDFSIEKSTTGNLFISQQSTTDGFFIKQSTTGDFFIKQSTTGRFSISQQSTTGRFSISQQSTIGYFSIEQSTTGYFYIWQSTTGGFSIEQSTTSDFSIEKSTTGYFSIEKSATGNLFISQQSTTDGFFIKQSTTGDFFIKQSTTGRFSISQQSTTGRFSISQQSTTDYFSIWQSTTGDFSIEESTTGNFWASALYNSFYFVKATIAQVRLNRCYIPELKIDSGCEVEVYIADSELNLVDLQHLTLSKDSVISFFNCRVYACLMEEFAVLGSLFFRQVGRLAKPFDWYQMGDRLGKESDDVSKKKAYEAKKALFTTYKDNYQKHLDKLQNSGKGKDGNDNLHIIQSTFRVAQSSLGKTEFTDCDLAGFRFEFNNAKITEVFVSGGTLPGEGIVIYNGNEEDKEEKDPLKREEQKVSVYNQLKKIFDNQGDVYWATHFQAKTAEHQHEVLKLRREDDRKKGGEFFSTTFWDIITFWFNRLSNKHGESWGRAFMFTAGVAALFYVAFLVSIGRIFRPTDIDWNLAGQYFSYLDPTHKITFLGDDVKLNFLSYLIDFLSRIFVGYGIYQFIAAFRKHGKK